MTFLLKFRGWGGAVEKTKGKKQNTGASFRHQRVSDAQEKGVKQGLGKPEGK